MVGAALGVGGKIKEIFGGGANAVDLGTQGKLAGATLNLQGGVSSPTPPVINTLSLPSGTVGTPWTQTFSATAQNLDPVSWSLVAGAFPAGLSLDSTTGILSGTPTIQGAFAFTIQAMDTAVALSATRAYTTSVTAGGPTINTGSLPAAIYGSAYSQTLSAATSPIGDGVAWSVAAGPLPSWLSLDPSSGVLSGTPSSVSPSSFVLAATDKVTALSSSLAYVLSVAGTAPSISTASLPAAVWGTAYSQTLSASTTPAPDGVNWALVSGSLPAGLSACLRMAELGPAVS